MYGHHAGHKGRGMCPLSPKAEAFDTFGLQPLISVDFWVSLLEISASYVESDIASYTITSFFQVYTLLLKAAMMFKAPS